MVFWIGWKIGGMTELFSSSGKKTWMLKGWISWLEYSTWLFRYITGWWFQPLWKMWKSVGMIIPNIWKNKTHVPNHQPNGYSNYIYICNIWILGNRLWNQEQTPRKQSVVTYNQKKMILKSYVDRTMQSRAPGCADVSGLWSLGYEIF